MHPQDPIFEAFANRIKAIAAVANHLRHCRHCGEMDVKECDEGNRLWNAAEMDMNPPVNTTRM